MASSSSSSASASRSKGKTIGSSTFDPDAFLDTWDPAHGLPQNNDLQHAITNAFGLKQTDTYVYHALASVTLRQVQGALAAGGANGMHAWYRDEAGEQIPPPTSADVDAYTHIFQPTSVTSKALSALAGNAKKGSLRAAVAQHLQTHFHPPPKDAWLALPGKQKTAPIPNPALDFWTWSCRCLEWAGPEEGTVRVRQSHHVLPVFYHHFGCVCPTWDALSLIVRLAKPPKSVGGGGGVMERSVLDLGSGNGYWTFLLRRLGVTVYAVDNALSAWRTMWIADTIQADAISFLKNPQKYTKSLSLPSGTSQPISPGGAGAILLLVYPQVSNDFTINVLNAYTGDVIVVAGTQNLNGFTGPAGETVASWMEREKKAFERVAQIPLPSFAGKDEALFVFVRKEGG